MTAVHVKKGDKVIVIAGKDKGKQGEVINVLTKNGRVRVSGINMAKRHTKPSMGNAGGIVERELPIDASNVALVDPKTGKATRVGIKVLEDGKKVRFAKKSGEVIDN
jgi:large subunit ribosomal protein L24